MMMIYDCISLFIVQDIFLVYVLVIVDALVLYKY